MKIVILLTTLLFLLACNQNKANLDNAKFEIEQGNLKHAKELIAKIPEGTTERITGDSLLNLQNK